ncbi:type II secretion system F family protein [Candidatus Micrarchaeota archaeon]|nr:type II secretion system F family protein [Candidatus Micrarchaeota archaeon]
MPREEDSKKKGDEGSKKKKLELPAGLVKNAQKAEMPLIVLPPDMAKPEKQPMPAIVLPPEFMKQEKQLTPPIVLPPELTKAQKELAQSPLLLPQEFIASKPSQKPVTPPAQITIPKEEKKQKEIPVARKTPEFGGPNQLELLLNFLSAKFPNLKRKLKLAEIPEDPNTFVANASVFSLVLAFAFTVLFFIILDALGWTKLWLAPLFAVILVMGFAYYMKIPDVKMIRKSKEIDKDIVFAGRHMLIELRAGVPLFDAMLNITRDYGEISKAFARILEKINVGVPADVAMHDVAEDSPSISFKRVMLQLVNSLRSGSNVADSLEVILDQVSREQVIAIKEYGQKLSPLAMFYMVFGIIIPSMGIALAITLMSFLRLKFGPELLVAVFFVIAVIQYIFLTMIESSRPQLEV